MSFKPRRTSNHDRPSSPLALPVVIPQQRPGSKERGFMAAYAPSLETCGIDQAGFLGFIDEVNTALEGNKYLAGVQVVSFGVGLTPDLMVMGISAAVSAGLYVANKSFVKHKTNTVLDKYNEQVLAPRGLFCMIMKYKPEPTDSPDQPHYPPPQHNPPPPYHHSPFQQPGGFLSSRDALSRAAATSSGSRGASLSRNHIAGASEGLQSLPTAVAPLIYMDDRRQHKDYLSGISRRDTGSSPEVQNDKPDTVGTKAKRAFDNLNDYLDRRARARYAVENNGDVLNAPLTRSFTNRYLDPNHPATNGGLIGLLSGGVLTPDPETKRRRALKRAEEDESRLLEEYDRRISDIRNQNQTRHEIERQLKRCEEDYAPRWEACWKQRSEAEAGEKRSITSGILYLAIVNRPSDAEVAACSARLDQANRRGAVRLENV